MTQSGQWKINSLDGWAGDMKVLFLNPPSYHRFDGSGTRYHAKRKTKSLFYPVWLSYAAGLIDSSKVLDCPAEGIGIDKVLRVVPEFDIVVVHSTTPTLRSDIAMANLIKTQTRCMVVFVGAHVSVLPQETLEIANAIDAVARREYDYTILNLARTLGNNGNLENVQGLSWRRNDKIVHNPDRPLIRDLDKLPFVSSIYARDLPIKSYRLPQILHPYVSIYSGRGCPHRCTFCLWPQTFFSREYRTRSSQNVAEEVVYIKENLPEVEEILFEDDTFTASPLRVEEICELIEPLHVTWSANARADVRHKTLKAMRDAGCRLLIVGYESGNEQILSNINKGVTLEQMKRFTDDCHRLGIMIHGAFILGLPGETRTTIEQTLRFALDLDVDSIQVSIATPYPGTEFHRHCEERGYLRGGELTDKMGYQDCILDLPELSREEIVRAVDDFHARYLYRARYICKLVRQILRDRRELNRIMISGLQFQPYMIRRYLERIRDSSFKLT